MAKSNNQKRVQVTSGVHYGFGHISRLATLVDQFNKSVLPIFRQLHFEPTADFLGSYNVSRADLRLCYIAGEISAAKTELEKEKARIVAPEKFDEIYKGLARHNSHAVSEAEAAFVHLDEKTGAYIFDREAYTGNFAVWAEGEKAVEAYDRLMKVKEALSCLNFSRVGLNAFIRFADGQAFLDETINQATFDTFVESQNF